MANVTVKLTSHVDTGWRLRALMAVAPRIGWLPDSILDRLIDWATRGIRIRVDVSQSEVALVAQAAAEAAFAQQKRAEQSRLR